ncbi:MAG: penicillin-binding protein 2 [Candidatus Doudnabacteria bacterium]|nr:penicillin-binding protein 2 [Candidatus Doudnabacteria bacterium]
MKPLDPFESNAINRKIDMGKNLSFEEAYLNDENAEVMEDEREDVNYRVLGAVILIGLSMLGARLFYLQGIKGPTYKALAEGNKLRTQAVLAPRGLLLDRYDKTIAGNSPSFELVAITADFPKDKVEFDGRVTQISAILGIDTNVLSESIKDLSKESYSAQTLVQNITKEQALILIAKAEDLKGFMVQDNPVRDYKDPLAFAHLTGYTGKITAEELGSHKQDNYLLNDYIGKSGIEYEYERYLRGVPGKRQAEVNATGDYQKTLAELPALPGNNVKLNIDYELQKVAFESLQAHLKLTRSRKGAVIATNPKTGEVLALVSAPGFDSNMFARGIRSNEYNALLNDPSIPLLNRAIGGTYPPGSTIKPVMAIAALSEGVVTPETKILDDGVIRVGSFTFYGYERSGLGMMDIYSAIAKSSDIYFYTVGGGNSKTNIDGMGPDKVASWFRKFHLGSPLGLDMPNEKSGLVPDPEWKERVKKEQWFLGNTYHMSIGQGDVLTTPLQVNSWTATIANGGKVMQPYILDQVIDRGGKVIAKGEPKILSENNFDQEYIKIVQEGMRQTVTIGSGRALANVGMEVSGKTGTAQFDARDLTLTHSWFTSYAPSNDPKIALTVLAEAAGEGHTVAVPIAKDIYEWYVQNRLNK